MKQTQINGNKPANGRSTGNEKAYINWCQLVGGVNSTKGVKQTGVNQGLGVFHIPH